MSFDRPDFAEKIGLGYLGWLFGGRRYNKMLDLMELTGDENVLEFGSGAGGLSRRLKKRCRNLTCLEPSKYYSELAKERLESRPGIRFVNAKIEQAGFDAGSFDTCVICYVLHDIPNSERSITLRAIGDAMKEGGILHIVEPTGNRHGMPAKEIESLMKTNGFKSLKSNEDRKQYYGRFMRKRLCDARLGIA